MDSEPLSHKCLRKNKMLKKYFDKKKYFHMVHLVRPDTWRSGRKLPFYNNVIKRLSSIRKIGTKRRSLGE